MAEWQPIETAPKDGAPFLVYWDYFGRHEYAAVRFVSERWDASGWEMLGCEAWLWPEGITHWMPLPEPPEAA